MPLAAAAEGQFALATWCAAAPTAAAGWRLTSQIVLTGLYFYGYSEVARDSNPNPNPNLDPNPSPSPAPSPNPNPSPSPSPPNPNPDPKPGPGPEP